ncbi:hypothetical protein [Roseovarius ramblicola]|uniref:Uncharacterized protein n=1 Tax=Roseovarius ramblicola TaxID=2022336 RepID=A0ABV5I4Z9_9RHOB
MTESGKRTFHYKPALMRPAQEVRLDGDRLWIAGDGPFELSRVEVAAFVTHSLGDSQMVRLDLTWPGARRAIGFNGGRRGHADNPDAREHRAAVAAVLRALAAARPDMTVTLGAPRGARWTLFGFGVLALLSGAGIGAAVLAEGLSGGRLAGAAMPVLLLVLIGAALVIGHWPWTRRRAVDAAALAERIASP